MAEANEIIRPTKKQREMLTYIQEFIAEHGYSPSYREIMAGKGYTSVASVALHVNNLIKRGHLRKRDHSARSLEVVASNEQVKLPTNIVKPGEEKWLIEKVEFYFAQAEQASIVQIAQIEDLTTLINSLRVLGLDGAAQSFVARLNSLKEKLA
jgi:repressor LexA